ncbi:hypothetical protein [Kribbella flavida]|nr:hypothetical protein [Kribbella flavida]
MLLALPLVIAGWVGVPGVAAAAVVVPPGGAGHTCSGYHYSTPYSYWQTCAWADHQYVWFTVNFGNSGDEAWYPEVIAIDYISSGSFKSCPAGYWETPEFVIGRNATRSTPRLSCVITRRPGAYASNAYVEGNPLGYDSATLRSPTLQVQ